MTVSSLAQTVVVCSRPRVMLNAGTSPVIQRWAEARLTRVAHMDEARAFAAPFGHRRCAGEGAQRGIIAIGQGAGRLGEHRGGHYSSDTWQGPENLDVTMLARL